MDSTLVNTILQKAARQHIEAWQSKDLLRKIDPESIHWSCHTRYYEMSQSTIYTFSVNAMADNDIVHTASEVTVYD